MNTLKRLRKSLAVALTTGTILTAFSMPVYASDIDQQIIEQQRVLDSLMQAKKEAKNNELDQRITEVQQGLNALTRQMENSRSHFDAEGAFNSINYQIAEIQKQLQEQSNTQQKLIEWLNAVQEKLTANDNRMSEISERDTALSPLTQIGSSRYLVQPDDSYSRSSSDENYYTQDAANAQGNSTMVFAYAPNQLYKIYCRRGFLTDVALYPGEEITYIAGGDTAGWSVISNYVNCFQHLQIKPVVETSQTNIIVNTNKHTYQLVVNTSDWYNPMVTWRYDTENEQMNLLRKSKEEQLVTGTINTNNIENLDFNYKITGAADAKPSMVFSDGEKTYIKFENARKQYPLFIREQGKRDMNLVNYKIKDGYYIVEKIFDIAQFRISDTQTVTIKRKGAADY